MRKQPHFLLHHHLESLGFRGGREKGTKGRAFSESGYWEKGLKQRKGESFVGFFDGDEEE